MSDICSYGIGHGMCALHETHARAIVSGLEVELQIVDRLLITLSTSPSWSKQTSQVRSVASMLSKRTHSWKPLVYTGAVHIDCASDVSLLAGRACRLWTELAMLAASMMILRLDQMSPDQGQSALDDLSLWNARLIFQVNDFSN